MTPKKTLAGLSATAMIAGGVDASVMNEQPIERLETIANERVEFKQLGDVVETTMPWKGEDGLKIKYDMGKPTLMERIKDTRNGQVITEVVYNSQGFKMDIILNERPADNCFTYQIDGWEDYVFSHQPPLTPEEIAEGLERPEEIVGSYAVYHKFLANQTNHKIDTSKLTLEEENQMVLTGEYYKKKNPKTGEYEMFKYGINYSTGKVAHIPYPYVWEVGKKEATKQRAENFNVTDGEMKVCASDDFLDTADYSNGVRIDPTFGYTTIGGSTINTDDTGIGTRFTLSEDATVESMSLYVSNGNSFSDVKMGIYKQSDDSLVLEGNNDVEADGPAWITDNVTDTALSAGDYWLIWVQQGGVRPSPAYDTGTTDYGAWDTAFSDAGSAFPSTLGSCTFFCDKKYSIYATYTATGGEEEATTTPVTTISGGTAISGGAIIR